MSELNFEGLTLSVAADGSVGPIRLAPPPEPEGSASNPGQGPLIADQLRVWLPGPWQPGQITVLHDELSMTWLHPLGAHAVLRQVWDLTWSIRVSLVNPTAEPLLLPGPRLELAGPWPLTSWAAGSRAVAWLPIPGGEQVFALRLIRGAAVAEQAALASPELELAAAGGPRASQTWAWVAEVTDRAALTAELPNWWPTRVAGDEGEEWQLRLPDGAVAGNQVENTEDGFLVRPPAGVTRYTVDEAGEQVLLDLWVAPSLDQRVSELLSSHPVRPGVIDPALTVLALAGRGLGLDPELWEDHLEAADELTDPDGPAWGDPLALLALALIAQHPPRRSAQIGAHELQALSRWPNPTGRPGGWLALVQARWAALLAGAEPPAEPAPDEITVAQQPEPPDVAAAVRWGERDLVQGRLSEPSRVMLSLIDATLPARPQLSDELVAVIAVAAEFAPEDAIGSVWVDADRFDPDRFDEDADDLDEFEQERAPSDAAADRAADLGLAVQQAKQLLLAGSSDLRALAWLASAALRD